MRKTWLILVLSFVVPFLIGGIGVWLWTEGTSDRPHGALASDTEIAEAERQIDKEASDKFFGVGCFAGFAGLLVSGSLLFIRKSIQRAQ